jgi:hypothetical protein
LLELSDNTLIVKELKVFALTSKGLPYLDEGVYLLDKLSVGLISLLNLSVPIRQGLHYLVLLGNFIFSMMLK